LSEYLKTSEKGKQIIKDSEGLRLSAYTCPAGKWTIGYGHTGSVDGKKVGPGMVIDLAKADELLAQDLLEAEQCVKDCVDIELNQNQFDALVSLVFNIGCGAFEGSTLRAIVNGMLPADKKVPWEKMVGGIKNYLNKDSILTNLEYNFLRWCNTNGKGSLGLFKRRIEEYKLFIGR